MGERASAVDHSVNINEPIERSMKKNEHYRK